MKPKMIIPMPVCRDAGVEIEFCKQAFGTKELPRRTDENGMVVHATLKIHNSLFMVHDESSHLASRAPQPDGSSPVVTYLYVEDTDKIIKQAVDAGAQILSPAEAQSWGDRVGRIIDPAGHVWNIAARIREE